VTGLPAVIGRAGPDEGARPVDRASQIPASGVAALIAELRRRGYRVIAPVARDGALVLDEIRSGAELPWGLGAETGPGHYRLVERGDRMLFAGAVGPMPWKRFLRPPREKILDVDRESGAAAGSSDGGKGGLRVTEPDAHGEPPLAFLGVRPCDLRALTVLDRVMLAAGTRSAYAVRRSRSFIVAIECTESAETCFCVSASASLDTNCGPGATLAGTPGAPRYDLLLTEVDDGAGHRFLARSGSCRGAEVLARIPHVAADVRTASAAGEAVARAAESQSRRRGLPAGDLRSLMAASVDAQHWSDIAQRCLTCGNCTLVCPTCFCTTTEDTTDLTGEHAERWNSWASCFDLDFSYVHGGEVRHSVESRYRQWLTHKFGTWQDQFSTSGCVGCGRCIAWCPAGIDLTEELRALQDEWKLEASNE
jgi:ferredoxin